MRIINYYKNIGILGMLLALAVCAKGEIAIVDVERSMVGQQDGVIVIVAARTAVFEISDFEEVWQYGSKRDRPVKLDNEDVFFLQDGVAAQRSLKGLNSLIENNILSETYGRAFIPSGRFFKKSFLKSHSEENYEWIFDRETEDDGYVNPK